jgi:hypothetical protein
MLLFGACPQDVARVGEDGPPGKNGAESAVDAGVADAGDPDLTDSGPLPTDSGIPDAGPLDAGGVDAAILDAGPGFDAATLFDGGQDSGLPDAGLADAGLNAGVDAGFDVGKDAGTDAGIDAGIDSGNDSGLDAGIDAGLDSGNDAGLDAGPPDAGIPEAGMLHDPPWWDFTFPRRRALTFSHNGSDVEVGDPIRIEWDHAAEVMQGQSLATGDDVRFVYWNGSAWTELDRSMGTGSAWNVADSRPWFGSPFQLLSGSTDVPGLYLYYGNGAPDAPPEDLDAVYGFGDNFNDGSLKTGMSWSLVGNANASEMGGEWRITMGTDVGDGAIVAETAPLETTERFLVEHKFNVESLGGPSNPEAKALVIAQQPGIPASGFNDPINDARRILAWVYDNGDLRISYYDTSGTRWDWDETNTQWTTTATVAATITLGSYYRYLFWNNGTEWRMVVNDSNGNRILRTDWVTWSSVRDENADPYWLYWGEPYDNFYYGDMRSDFFIHRKWLANLPNFVIGGEEDY